jgi:hypothetical protein
MMNWSIWKVILQLNGACLLVDFATAYGKRLFFPTAVHKVQSLRWATAAATAAAGKSRRQRSVLLRDQVPLYYEEA